MGRLVVPMMKEGISQRALDIAFQLSGNYKSEITAFTVKDEVHDLSWSDKVALVTGAYIAGKERDLKVVPKVRTSKSVKDCIVDEVNSHGYDMVLMGAERHSPFSASMFGTICEFVLKNSRPPVVAVSVRSSSYPYRNILLPLSEGLSTRASAAFAMRMSKAGGSKLHIADLRKYDTRQSHGFHKIFDNLGALTHDYGPDIEVIRGGTEASLNDEVNMLASRVSADLIVLGIQPDSEKKIRFNSSIKSALRDSVQDTILVKK